MANFLSAEAFMSNRCVVARFWECMMGKRASCLYATAIALTLALLPLSALGFPISTTSYAADPSAHVFEGRMHVYASHDRVDARNWNIVDYHIYSTDDMQNWRDHEIAFRVTDSKGAGNE